MFLHPRSLQMVTFLAILFLAWFATCQDTEIRRAVTEHQLMHDKGRAFQGLKRQMWLQHALGTVHTASGRDVALSDGTWDSQKGQHPSDLYSSVRGDETSSLVKRLLEKEQGLPLLKQLDLQNGKTPKGNWSPPGLFGLLQIKELGTKREPSTQPQNYSH